jgi:hypothetical protein
MILLRRFAFALVATLLSQNSTQRNVAFVFLHMASLLFHQSFAPFSSADLNRTESLSYIILFAVSNTLVLTPPPYSLLAQLILFCLIVPPTIFFFILTVRDQIPKIRLHLARLLPKQQRSQLTISGDAGDDSRENHAEMSMYAEDRPYIAIDDHANSTSVASQRHN